MICITTAVIWVTSALIDYTEEGVSRGRGEGAMLANFNLLFGYLTVLNKSFASGSLPSAC